MNKQIRIDNAGLKLLIFSPWTTPEKKIKKKPTAIEIQIRLLNYSKKPKMTPKRRIPVTNAAYTEMTHVCASSHISL